MRAIIPKMKEIPEGATKADRIRMYDEYMAELRRLNPKHYNADGSLKSTKQWMVDCAPAIIIAAGSVVVTLMFF